MGCRKRDTGAIIDKCAGVNAADFQGSARWSCLHCARVMQETSMVREQANLVGEQANVAGEGEQRGAQEVEQESMEVINTGGGEELIVPGEFQVEDNHGYSRRQGSPAPAPPQQNDLPSAHVAQTTHIPTATHIPKSCRVDYARVLADTVSASLNNPQDFFQ